MIPSAGAKKRSYPEDGELEIPIEPYLMEQPVVAAEEEQAEQRDGTVEKVTCWCGACVLCVCAGLWVCWWRRLCFEPVGMVLCLFDSDICIVFAVFASVFEDHERPYRSVTRL